MATTDKQQYESFKQFGSFIAYLVIFLDLYFYCFNFFYEQGLTADFLTKVLGGFDKAGFFSHPIKPKIVILVMTVLFVMFDKGKKNVESDKKSIIYGAISATVLFVCVSFVPFITKNIFIYGPLFIGSYLYLIKMYSLINRLFDNEIMDDRFNKKNKIFPQMTELIENELSVNIPYKFVSSYEKKKGRFVPITTDGYINIISPERASIILGKPGSGKSYSFNEEYLRQHIMKGFSIINYDFKFPTLTNVAYNYFTTYKGAYAKYANKGRFAVINIDDPRYSDRCNPLHRDLLEKRAQAMDAVKTIYFNLDKKSATKQDFFQMSAIAITSAALWFLRMYENGKYCSFPHLIEYMQQPDEKMLTILDSYDELKYFTSAFTDALQKESFEQLSGQTASARIPLGQCATDEMFYVMTDPDNNGVNLRVNLPDEVTVLNIANNPETQLTNAPALGLYMSQAAKLINAQDRVPCNFHVDELPTIFINGLNTLIATARSNKVCVTLSAQDYTQLVNNYGKDIADTIFNTIDTIISGKVAIDTAKKITESIGKINYQNQSISISENTSSTISTQQQHVVPAEDISQLSQGEFVGVVSDNFKNPIDLKVFRGLVSPSKEDLGDLSYPMINPDITSDVLKENTQRIRDDINRIVENEMKRLEDDKEKEKDLAEEQAMEGFGSYDNFNPEFNVEDEEIEDTISDQPIEIDDVTNELNQNQKEGLGDEYATLLNSIEPLTTLPTMDDE